MVNFLLFIRSTFFFLYGQLEFLCGQLFTSNKIKFYFLCGQLDFLRSQLFTFCMVNLESFQNRLHPINNKDGCLYSHQRTQRVGTVFIFDNLKILLLTVSSFKEAERCNNLSFEDVDQAADRLRTAAETIQLLTADIKNN